MYPCEPFSAAAFMNSASSCLSVSGLSFGGDATERTLERATIASTRVPKPTARNLLVFIQPPETRTILTPQQKERTTENTESTEETIPRVSLPSSLSSVVNLARRALLN